MTTWRQKLAKKRGKKSQLSFSWPSRDDGDRIRASESGVDTKSPAAQPALDGIGAPVTLPAERSGHPEPLPRGERRRRQISHMGGSGGEPHGQRSEIRIQGSQSDLQALSVDRTSGSSVQKSCDRTHKIEGEDPHE